MKLERASRKQGRSRPAITVESANAGSMRKTKNGETKPYSFGYEEKEE